jgi:hypothetical protein
MRSILVDWLIEVSEEYHLENQTLLLGVLYLDLCIRAMIPVSKATFQLLGITCLFLAAYGPP